MPFKLKQSESIQLLEYYYYYTIEMYAIGEKVECIDCLGIWSLAIVLRMINSKRWEVKFDGYSRQWNREVKDDKIRKLTRSEEHTRSGRKRKVSFIVL